MGPVPSFLRHLPRGLVLLGGLSLATGLPAQDEGPVLGLADENETLEEVLEELSSWSQDLEQGSTAATRGTWPVGDGRVFGFLGFGPQANALNGLSGPGYALAEGKGQEGAFGSMVLELRNGDQVLPLERQRIWSGRGSNLVFTEDRALRGQGPVLTTMTFAVPGTDTIHRWVEVRNESDAAGDWSLVVRMPKASPDGPTLLQARYAPRGYLAQLSSSRRGRATQGSLAIPLGSLAPKAGIGLALHLRMAHEGQPFAGAEASEEALGKALDQHLSHWSKRLASSTTTSMSRVRISDLLEDWKVRYLVLRDERSGLVADMLGDRSSSLRALRGPLLAFLRYGYHAEAKALLDAHVRALYLRGRLEDRVSLDLDLSKVDLAGKDPSSLDIPNNELAAWLVLYHEWYVRATWDQAYLQERWPLLLALTQAQKPDARMTLPSSGLEPHLSDTFFELVARGKERVFLPADAPGRRARSLEASLLHLLCLNAMGELGEDFERVKAGAKAKEEGWTSKLKEKWETLHLDRMQAFEESFWLAEEERYAPFLSPIDGKPHRAPCGPVNLFPQWIGFTYSFGEHNRQNLGSSNKALWQNRARNGTTPNSGVVVGEHQGLLLYNLCDLDDRNRNDALEDLVEMCTPSGGWASFHGEDGRPIARPGKELQGRLATGVAGVNLDSIFFALNGIRYVCSPGWSKKDQRFKLRLPREASWMSMKDIEHDGHAFHIFMDRIFEKDAEEDPSGGKVEKLRFRLRYVRVNKELGLEGSEYVDVAINVGGTVFVRYPSTKEELSEKTPWPVDDESFLRKKGGFGSFAGTPLKASKDQRTLLITSQIGGTRPDDAYVLDIGLPILPGQLADLILSKTEDGKRRFDTLLFDIGARSSGRSTQKDEAFWNDPKLVEAGKTFAQQGGRILLPTFARDWSLLGPFPADRVEDMARTRDIEKPQDFGKGDWKALRSEDPQALDLGLRLGGEAGKGARGIGYASTRIESPMAGEVILRTGSVHAIKVWLNGKLVHETKEAREARPDQDEVLIRLNKGTNRVLIKAFQDGVPAKLYLRVTTLEGLPMPGLSYR